MVCFVTHKALQLAGRRCRAVGGLGARLGDPARLGVWGRGWEVRRGWGIGGAVGRSGAVGGLGVRLGGRARGWGLSCVCVTATQKLLPFRAAGLAPPSAPLVHRPYFQWANKVRTPGAHTGSWMWVRAVLQKSVKWSHRATRASSPDLTCSEQKNFFNGANHQPR